MPFVSPKEFADDGLEDIVGFSKDDQEEEPAGRTYRAGGGSGMYQEERGMRDSIAKKHDSQEINSRRFDVAYWFILDQQQDRKDDERADWEENDKE